MGDLGVKWENGEDFLEWVDLVFEHVRDRLGGAGEQSGQIRYYADGEFNYAADAESGDAAFCVDHPGTGAMRVQTFIVDWRSYQPARVAERLIDAYALLARTA